jgi:hypothetical protein
MYVFMYAYLLFTIACTGEKAHIAHHESDGKKLHIDQNFITYSPLKDCWLTHHLSRSKRKTLFGITASAFL